MSINPQISNGTCYYATGKKANSQFIPCGNDVTGRKSCCGLGDNCLSNRACYSGKFKMTYLTGCTDPEYKDESCPDKGAQIDLPWTGLVYCNGTSEEWITCDQQAKPSTLAKGDFCFCPETSRTVAFRDKSTLENIASLPTAAGNSIMFQAGHAPGPVTVTALRPGASTTTRDSAVGATSPSSLSPTSAASTSPSETGAAGAGSDTDSGSSAGLSKASCISSLLAPLRR